MSRKLALLIGLPLIILSSAGIVAVLNAEESHRGPGLAGASTSTLVAQTATAGGPEDPGVPAPAEGGKGPAAGQTAGQAAGQAAKPVNAAVPPEVAWYPDRVYRGASVLYRLSDTQGILSSSDGGATWASLNNGLPGRTVYGYSAPRPPLFTSFAIDPANDARIAFTIPEAVYLSENGGQVWTRVDTKDPVKPNDQLIAVSLSPVNPKGLLIGTSFHGIFETADLGKTWKDMTEKIGFMYLGGGSYEEVSSLAYHPADPDLFYFSLGFGKGLYSLRKGAKTAARIVFPGDKTRDAINDLSFRQKDGKWVMEVRTDNARWIYDPAADAPKVAAGPAASDPTTGPAASAWALADAIQVTPSADPAREARAQKASGKIGIYISSMHADGKRLDDHIAFCLKNGINSIVVDFKDEFGTVTYDTGLPEPKRIGAVKKRFSAAELIKKAHDNGLYLIARIVTFRDEKLYNADSYALAAWDRTSNKPWRYLVKNTNEETGEETFTQSEYWVDPYAEKTWKYNVDIARELESLGVDEIQFDYIRFPSDGDLSRISWRARKAGQGKVEALESFLSMARQNLSIPISTDVYGYCGWARISGWVAQNIEVFSRYVDVISPMYYPSHFPRDFLGGMEYISRANFIYKEGTDRAARIVQGRSIIRPYIQAFLIGGELNFSTAVYTSYFLNQVQGTIQAASSGFTLWNASNNYYMVPVPLAAYLTTGQAGPAAGAGG